MSYLHPCLDSDVWIAAITGPPRATTPEKFKVATDILGGVDAAGMKVVASTLLQVEVIKHPAAKIPADHHELIAKVLSRSIIEWFELDPRTAVLARRLRSDYALRTADAVHLATAIRGRADVLLTWDKRLLKVADAEPVPVREPYWPGPNPLPMEVRTAS